MVKTDQLQPGMLVYIHSDGESIAASGIPTKQIAMILSRQQSTVFGNRWITLSFLFDGIVIFDDCHYKQSWLTATP